MPYARASAQLQYQKATMILVQKFNNGHDLTYLNIQQKVSGPAAAAALRMPGALAPSGAPTGSQAAGADAGQELLELPQEMCSAGMGCKRSSPPHHPDPLLRLAPASASPCSMPPSQRHAHGPHGTHTLIRPCPVRYYAADPLLHTALSCHVFFCVKKG